jgi:hypothetical protein
MLKIVTGTGSSDDSVLYLEGQVIGPWVEELRRVCESFRSRGARLQLDLANVSFVSREGVELLSRLRDRDARFLNCSRFVAEQLGVHDP